MCALIRYILFFVVFYFFGDEISLMFVFRRGGRVKPRAPSPSTTFDKACTLTGALLQR